MAQTADGVGEFKLSEALAPCRPKHRKVRKLWGDGKGLFRTRRKANGATVRDTRWLVQDSCDGTLTRVAVGVVSVRDTVRRKTVLLRAGRSYLARPKR